MSVGLPGPGVRPIVGRTAEIRTLHAALRGVREGGTSVISVTGEPGIGKTRLLREASVQAAALGLQVLEGQGTDLEREIPYAMVIDALDQPFGALRRTELRLLCAEELAELGWLLPSLSALASPLSTPLQIERHRCHRAVRRVLHQLAAWRPVLLVLDDVHCADHASLEVIAHLLRHPVPRLALLLANRSRQLPDTHASVLAHAACNGTLTALELGPLSLDETAELLPCHALDRIELAQLHRSCGGNPFYLQELARAHSGFSGSVGGTMDTLDSSGVPSAIQAALEQEVQPLSLSARSLLQSAAVIGRIFDIELAIEIAESTEADARCATDELVRSGLIHQTGAPGRLAFRHPIVHLAIYQRSGYAWRRRAHQRAAAALDRRGAAVSVRAHHLEHCGEVGDEQAIDLLTEAGMAAAPRAPHTAVRWFRAALRLLPDDAPARRRLSLSVALADALSATGHLGECSAVLRQALDLIPSNEAEDRVPIMARIAVTEQRLGNAAEGLRLLTTAASLSAPGSPEAAGLRLQLAESHLMMRDWHEAARLTAEVQQSTTAREDRRLYLIATAASAFMGALHGGQSLGDSRRSLDEAASALDALTDTEIVPALLDGLTHVAYAEILTERWGNAVAHSDRGIRLCHETGHGRHLVELQNLRALGLLLQGHLDIGLSAAATAAKTALLLDNAPLMALTEATRCWLLTLMGRTTEALQSGALSMRFNVQMPTTFYAWHAPLVYGSALIEAGRYRRGRQEIIKIAGEVPGEVYPTLITHFYRFLVDAELALGRVDAAEKTTRRVETIVATMPTMHMRLGDARYCRAHVQLTRKEVRAAADNAEQAAAEYSASGTPLDAARARLLFGHVLADLHDVAAAKTEFDAALAVFELCGAERLAERARLALHRVGERKTPGPRSRSRATTVRLGDLTERQSEIVDRVVLGRTNRQISQELYVSEKTVEAHLTRLYTKLGVSSRTELAALAASDRIQPRR
ncbi:helix-turn-helix transcriptional regulator [Nocardia niwae]|uniref:helix-turn-helix transcriptional regulator n=1 Tax=Nocardia niwae TaxID=626084 RepID=UPI0033CF4D20